MIRTCNESAHDRPPRVFRALLCLILLLPADRTVGHAGGEQVAIDQDRLHRLQAAFVYNFLKYVSWPDDAFAGSEEPYRLCVINNSEFAHVLAQTVEGRTAQDRGIAVRDIRSVYAASPDHLHRCHAVYVDSRDPAERDELLRRLRAAPVLTVGEGRAFAEHGGVISFGIEDRKLALYINRDAAQRARLRISAKLLKRAKLVAEREGHGP